MKHHVRGPYSKRERVTVSNGGESLAKQSFKDECDINNIIHRFTKTGILEHQNRQRGQYAVADSRSFTEAMLLVTEAKSTFEQLPAQMRAKFENDPARFLDFVSEDTNVPEMIEMGLVSPSADFVPMIDPEPSEEPSEAPPETPPE